MTRDRAVRPLARKLCALVCALASSQSKATPDLKRKLMRYTRQYNKAPRTVKWKYADPSRHISTQSVGTGH